VCYATLVYHWVGCEVLTERWSGVVVRWWGVVAWEVCCDVGWEEEEVTGRRVQKCRRLSSKPVVKRQTEQKPSRSRLSRKWINPKNN